MPAQAGRGMARLPTTRLDLRGITSPRREERGPPGQRAGADIDLDRVGGEAGSPSEREIEWPCSRRWLPPQQAWVPATVVKGVGVCGGLGPERTPRRGRASTAKSRRRSSESRHTPLKQLHFGRVESPSRTTRPGDVSQVGLRETRRVEHRAVCVVDRTQAAESERGPPGPKLRESNPSVQSASASRASKASPSRIATSSFCALASLLPGSAPTTT